MGDIVIKVHITKDSWFEMFYLLNTYIKIVIEWYKILMYFVQNKVSLSLKNCLERVCLLAIQ